MSFIAPVASAIGGLIGFSGTAATVAGTAAMGLGVASAVNKDVRRIALPALGGAALGGLLAPTTGALSGSASLGSLGTVSKSALLGGAMGGYAGMKMNEAAKMRQMQEDYYNNQKAYMAQQQAEVSRQNAEMRRRAASIASTRRAELSIENERMARLQQRMQRGRRRGWNDDEYYGTLNALLG